MIISKQHWYRYMISILFILLGLALGFALIYYVIAPVLFILFLRIARLVWLPFAWLSRQISPAPKPNTTPRIPVDSRYP